MIIQKKGKFKRLDSMKKYLFLDFDGVMFNTLKEAYIICRQAYRGTDYFEPIDKAEYNLFYRYKFLVYNSWHYYYIMSLISKGLNDKEFTESYYTLLKNRDLNAESEFDRKYYSAREDLITNHNEFWNSLETPFEFCSILSEKNVNIIVSKKNKAAIKYRLDQYGINIPTDNIYGRDELLNYDSKAEFISEYMTRHNIPEAFFIDDNSNNLEPCKDYPNIKPFLAGWGNIAIGETGLTVKEIESIINHN